MKQCNRCLLKRKHGIEFDSNGVCLYCNEIDKNIALISSIGSQENRLRERLSLFRDKGEYDCVVGLSGGKDSSYIIYRLKNHYGARVLAYTCDNGFLNEYARSNIDTLVNEFGIDHVWVKPSPEVLREIYSNNIKNEGWPCSACFHMLEASAWKLAYEKQIPFIVSGRTPEQVLRRPDRTILDPFDSVIADNFSGYDSVRVRKLASRALTRIEENKRWLLPDRAFWPLATTVLYSENDITLKSGRNPEWLGFFLYEPHDETYIIKTLEKETNWHGPDNRVPLSHADCDAHDAAGYLFSRSNGFTLLNLEVASSIRINKLTRSQGEKILKDESHAMKKFPKKSIETLARVSGIDILTLRLIPFKIWLKRNLRKGYQKLIASGNLK